MMMDFTILSTLYKIVVIIAHVSLLAWNPIFSFFFATDQKYEAVKSQFYP